MSAFITLAMAAGAWLLTARRERLKEQRGQRNATSSCLGKDPNIRVSIIQDRKFRALTQFNNPDGLNCIGRKHRLAPEDKLYGVHRNISTQRWFSGSSLTDRLARSLAKREAIDLKEFAESLEFFHCVRKSLRSKTIVDVCCGHGFTGFLFAMFEKTVELVVCIDVKRVKGFDLILDAVVEVAPWVKRKVQFRQDKLESLLVQDKLRSIPTGCSVLGIHCCGELTDHAIDFAIAAHANIAVAPCCYHQKPVPHQPPAFKKIFGRGLAIDLARTSKLHKLGYSVDWKVFPRAVSDKNRILVGRRAD